jgi:hypothetical protein
MPADFKDWHDSPGERPETAAAVIRNLREREQMAWEQVAAAQEQERKRCAAIVQANADACLPGMMRDVLASNAAAIRAQDQPRAKSEEQT